ncbi:MAG: hypothetical protein HY238_05650 [Acidobacteria bacterium]|nr:hypothetical protein [Acidobacteriota bacterium]
MKITDVESFLMSYVFPEPLKLAFWGGERTILKRDAMLVKISTDAGLTGYGPGAAWEGAQREVAEQVRPALVGQDPAGWRDLRGPAGAAEIALLDLAGKAEGCAVSELVGGRLRDRIRLYGSGGMYMPAQRYAGPADAESGGAGDGSHDRRPHLVADGGSELLVRDDDATLSGHGGLPAGVAGGAPAAGRS